MSKILLIDCEKPVNTTTGFPLYSEPLGLECLQAYLCEGGHDADIIRLPSDKFETAVSKAEIIGLSVLTYQWPFFINLATEIRRINPSVKLIAGREHPTAMPKECLEQAPEIDFIVCGEGEIPMLQVANGVLPENIPGLAYRSANGVKINSRPPRLITWPLAIRSVNRMTIMNEEWAPLGEKAASIMLSRGCCFNCDFCTTRNMWGNKYICTNVDAVINEIEKIQRERGVSVFVFHDFMFPPKLLAIFCSKILSRRIKISFFVMMSATADEIDWKLMKDAGCFKVAIGLEIPSDLRSSIGKKHPFRVAKAFINEIAAAGILTRVYTIIGFPHEKSWQDTAMVYLQGLSEVSAHFLRVNFLTPFPGTNTWDKFRGNVIYDLPEGFRHFTTMEPVLKFGLSAEELVFTRNEILRKYYSTFKISNFQPIQKEMLKIFVDNLKLK